MRGDEFSLTYRIALAQDRIGATHGPTQRPRRVRRRRREMKRGPQRLHGRIFVLDTAADNAPDGCSVAETDPWERDILRIDGDQVLDPRGPTARFNTSPVEQVREDFGLFDRVVEGVMGVLSSRAQKHREVVAACGVQSNPRLLLVDRLHIKCCGEAEWRTTEKGDEVPMHEQPVEYDRVANKHRAVTASLRVDPVRSLTQSGGRGSSFPLQAFAIEPVDRDGLRIEPLADRSQFAIEGACSWVARLEGATVEASRDGQAECQHRVLARYRPVCLDVRGDVEVGGH